MTWSTLAAPKERTAMSLGVLALGLGACSRERLVQGECRPVNGADVCAWDRMSGNTLVAFEATIPMRVIDSAPAEAPMTRPPVATATIPLSRVAQAERRVQRLLNQRPAVGSRIRRTGRPSRLARGR